jgi:predicted dehydrogenase
MILSDNLKCAFKKLVYFIKLKVYSPTKERGVVAIGCGNWGKVNIKNVILSKKWNLTGCFDTNFRNSFELASKYNIHHYLSLDEICSDRGVDAVIISTPLRTHKEIVMKFANAGFHIFIEKPMVSDPEIAYELVEFCENSGVLIEVGAQLRYEDLIRDVKKVIVEGRLGGPISMEAQNFVNNKNERLKLSIKEDVEFRNSMLELGIHFVDLVYFLFGPIKNGKCVKNIIENPLKSNHFLLEMIAKSCSGVMINIRSSFLIDRKFFCKIEFENGYIEFTNKGVLTEYDASYKQTHKKKYCEFLKRSGILQFREFRKSVDSLTNRTNKEEVRQILNCVTKKEF